MNIKLTKPYKVAPQKAKRYESHYHMPTESALVVPLRGLGEEVSCDIRWIDEGGNLQLLQNKIFVGDNLVPLNPLLDTSLYEMWQHYYENK